MICHFLQPVRDVLKLILLCHPIGIQRCRKIQFKICGIKGYLHIRIQFHVLFVKQAHMIKIKGFLYSRKEKSVDKIIPIHIFCFSVFHGNMLCAFSRKHHSAYHHKGSEIFPFAGMVFILHPDPDPAGCTGKLICRDLLSVQIIGQLYAYRKKSSRICRSFIMNILTVVFPFVSVASKACHLFISLFIGKLRQRGNVGNLLILSRVFKRCGNRDLRRRAGMICQNINRFLLIVFHAAFMIFVNLFFLLLLIPLFCFLYLPVLLLISLLCILAAGNSHNADKHCNNGQIHYFIF